MDEEVNPDHKIHEAAQVYDHIIAVLDAIPREGLSLDAKFALLEVKLSLIKMNRLINNYLDEVEAMVVDINNKLDGESK